MDNFHRVETVIVIFHLVFDLGYADINKTAYKPRALSLTFY